MDEMTISSYVNEAIELARQGKKVQTNKSQASAVTYEIPAMLDTQLKEDSELNEMWEGLTQRQRRDFVEYISEPKREATKVSRLERVLPVIREGKPLASIWTK